MKSPTATQLSLSQDGGDCGHVCSYQDVDVGDAVLPGDVKPSGKAAEIEDGQT